MLFDSQCTVCVCLSACLSVSVSVLNLYLFARYRHSLLGEAAQSREWCVYYYYRPVARLSQRRFDSTSLGHEALLIHLRAWGVQ